ncbi:transcription initiation factor TFIID subunit 4-like isoform X1 [Passer montanus]|uniref:transcription initiation factor TFIID subunit 4-like isoform X1 n=1 Tax=Passer montanus TaxID=9160 RepID=UPI00195F3B1F|nr:transcription initiation factor TFIID subunit 4-like isoform X1 [Passer montanus]
MLRVPTWNRGHSPVPLVLCHLPGRSSIPAAAGGPRSRGRATCTPSPRRAGTLGIPPGPCVRARVRRLFAISPGAACGRARCQPQPGKGGAGAAGARAGERSAAAAPRRRHLPCPAGGQQPQGRGAMARLLPVLLLAALGCAARRPAAWDGGADGNAQPGPFPAGLGQAPAPGAARGPSPAPPAQRPPARGCANLTLVLDNWKFAITSQLRNLLLSDHQTVLPDYGRIPALSGALDELYRDFRGLKEQLGRLSERFAHLEASVEQLSRARGAAAPPRRGGVPPSPRRAPGSPQ